MGKYNVRDCVCKRCLKEFRREKHENGGFCKPCLLHIQSFRNLLCRHSFQSKYCQCMHDPYEIWKVMDESPKCYICKHFIEYNKWTINRLDHKHPNTCLAGWYDLKNRCYMSCKIQFIQKQKIALVLCLKQLGVCKDVRNYILNIFQI